MPPSRSLGKECYIWLQKIAGISYNPEMVGEGRRDGERCPDIQRDSIREDPRVGAHSTLEPPSKLRQEPA